MAVNSITFASSMLGNEMEKQDLATIEEYRETLPKNKIFFCDKYQFQVKTLLNRELMPFADKTVWPSATRRKIF